MTVEEYNQAVKLFSDDVYRFIFKNLGDKERSEDIVQDTFEKVWLRLEKIEFKTIKNFLFTVAYRTMIDIIRSEKKNFYTDGETSEVALLTGKQNHYDGFWEVMEKAFELLTAEQKSLVLLRDYEGYSYKEIGEITALSESQVKVYIFRARKTLQNYIGKISNVLEA